ncbi:UNVERIFIED_CONTAM: hypothetical protein Sangu_3232900 [Sesamum angustifolium]|uniref:Uncharacterized protein n=1 Tax=Sesamum angustifolium TaxID=2727405 RepID=A0AAW2JGZ5_9LAMI
MVAYCTEKMTLIWITAIFMEKLGISQLGNKILTIRRPCMSFLGTYCLPLGCKGLYTSKAIVEHKTWYANHQTEGSMCYPSDAEAWRHFDRIYSCFAVEPSNVRLSLCMDGLTLNGEYDHTYSYWLVILTSYNLPPGMCISSDMFLKMVIPDPSNPKHLINVYLELLIEELQSLWHVVVLRHDNARN